MKKLSILFMLILMLALSAVPALAGSGGKAATPVVLNGIITAIDSQAMTFTISTVSGPLPKDSVVLVTTAPKTRYSIQVAPGSCVPADFGAFSEGDLIGVTGRFQNEVFVAIRITLKLK